MRCPLSRLLCRARCPRPAECRPKFISVAAGGRFRACLSQFSDALPPIQAAVSREVSACSDRCSPVQPNVVSAALPLSVPSRLRVSRSDARGDAEYAERCRTRRLLPMACSTLSYKTNLCENCCNNQCHDHQDSVGGIGPQPRSSTTWKISVSLIIPTIRSRSRTAARRMFRSIISLLQSRSDISGET